MKAVVEEEVVQRKVGKLCWGSGGRAGGLLLLAGCGWRL